jgi:hypothetical protein
MRDYGGIRDQTRIRTTFETELRSFFYKINIKSNINLYLFI